MKGYKVVVMLPEGRKNHFVPNLPNNLAGGKQALDQICAFYARKHGLVVSPRANYFDDQRYHVPPPKDHLSGVSPAHRCWCGWNKLGECASCPDELTFADNKKAHAL